MGGCFSPSSDLARIDAADYVRRLCTSLQQAYDPSDDRISISLAVEPVTLEVQTAMACGLILQELLSNSFKQAFPDEPRGEIGIALHGAPRARVVLMVWDTGVGSPPGLDFRQTESLGLQLVCLLSEQLNGTIELRHDAGRSGYRRFPASPPTQLLCIVYGSAPCRGRHLHVRRQFSSAHRGMRTRVPLGSP